MNKIFPLLFTIILLSCFASAADLEITKVDKGSVVIAELGNPAVFDFIINNKGVSENFEIYSLVGVSMSPRGTFYLPAGTSTIEVRAYLPEKAREYRGLYKFEYEIKGQNSGIFKDTAIVNIVPLKSLLEIYPEAINPESNEASILIKNAQNTNIENLKVHFSSDFYNFDKTISLKPYENITVTSSINKDETKKLVAGNYLVVSQIELDGAKEKYQSVVKYLEKEGLSVDVKKEGFIVRKTIITKTDEGNVPATAKIQTSKDIVSRLFTIFSAEPTSVERKGLVVDYTWEKQLNPGESFSVSTTTNYTFPFILLILIAVVTLLAKIYSQTAVVVDKRVSFVRTKGEHFALKVRLHVKAKKHVDGVQLIDRLPSIMKIYEKYGRMPDRIDHQTKRLFWDIGKLNSGEERVFSYIIYTNVKVVGRFELPAATAIFEREGRTLEVLSNRTYFASEAAVKEY